VVGCWRGYLSGAMCRFAYGPADATASVKSRLVFTFLVPAHLGSPGQRAAEWVCVCVMLERNETNMYQTNAKGKTNLDFTEARDSEWQWHQLGHMQVCTSIQTDNHASTPPLSFFTGRMPFLSPNQQGQSTECTSKGLKKK